RASKSAIVPQRGDFARVKRGLYGGDLAQVLSADPQGLFASVRLIPRIDLQLLLNKSSSTEALGSRRAKAGKPEKRFFDRDRVDASGGQVEQGLIPGTVKFAGLTFEEAGYIIRRVALRHLLLGPAVSPTLSELRDFCQKMSETDREETLAAQKPLLQMLKQQRSAFRLGDRVLVIQGELQGLRGKVSRLPQSQEEERDTQIQVTLDEGGFGDVKLKTFEKAKVLKPFTELMREEVV
ncbi:hypothetical protein ETH_00028015, partial [Eimeria tenella]